MLEKHQGKFALGRENRHWTPFGFPKAKGPDQLLPRDGKVDLAQVALEEPGVKRIKLFGLGRKCKTVLEIVDSSYLGHRH
ncbi:MAG: hypothetical protein R2814_12240 [Flavobacteriaceae bacterium]